MIIENAISSSLALLSCLRQTATFLGFALDFKKNNVYINNTIGQAKVRIQS